ncbi:hypothetical protein BUALT_Bualt03G0150700 [Buddleja alternifolia]|uniref:non-specific serine/threonine protein kinase n=1 Tax=Buddleja alternifolia TaxID=168488 RepID=A0AAV6Y0J9_9LAMI|nr:hypothetical protein BUALT_Bualt03G0150700 [Buddleja alternifolia]
MFFPRLLALICLVGFASGTGVLPDDEVESLRVIARSMGKRDWNFDVDPCSGLSGWVTQNPDKGFENAVTCNCTFANNTVCHIVSIDLTRNYLNGTIPPEWGSMNLVNISLLGNPITGSIPVQLANISTLANLTLECNQLSGTIPPELGNLPRIEKLLFGSNNLTGELPETLAKLTTLREFRISDNNFRGSIPSFIQNWTNIEKLMIQASGLTGPIPSSIASLTKLTDLRISDLNGNETTFPPLSTIGKTLILRSCNIVGELPSYIGEMTGLKVLDLSFNKLSGPIPNSFARLFDTDYMELPNRDAAKLDADRWGNNVQLSPIFFIEITCYFQAKKILRQESWHLSDIVCSDLSYNNLTSESSTSNCQPRDLNLFASSKGNTSGIVYCLRHVRCERRYSSLHINCGGRQERVARPRGTATYEEDTNSGGPSSFTTSRTNWGFSSTGHFLDEDRPIDSFVWSNSSSISGPNSQLYMNARLSPISLTYYGFCMINGNYTVYLHFAEIMFTSDRTYSSLGRRIFNIYIQGNLVWKDFNIEYEAGGVNKGITKNFTAIVTDNTLDIRFSWAGKGTTVIPVRGVYGPLISAISVDPDFTPPSVENGNSTSVGGNSISVGVIVGIAVGVLLTILLGLLSDGTIIAVKQLSAKSKQGNREFVNEIGMISALQHPHLVKLYGCCIEGNQLLLIYEYLENNSLARALFGKPQDAYEKGHMWICFVIYLLMDQVNANSLKEERNLMELVDPRLESNFNKEEVMTAINIGLHCTNVIAAERPNMSAVVSMLEGKVGVREFVSEPSASTGKMNSNTDEGQSISMDVPWTASSASTSDLYPLIVDTGYWEKRDQ